MEDMNDRRGLWVPLNEEGMEEYHHMGEESENLYSCYFPSEEFQYFDNNFVWDIYDITNVLIEDYEEETLTADDCRKCYKIVEKHKDKIPTFWKMFNLAIEKNTLLGVSC